jgi:integrase
MATVIRQPGTQYWIAAFRDATGKQHRRSTGETQKTRALEVAKQFERAGKGKGSPHRVKATFADFYREHYGIELPFSNVRTYCQNWLSTRKAETRPATYSRYEKTIERLLETLGDSAEKDLNEVTKSHVTAFRDLCLKLYATRTANLYLKIIKMVFRSARLDGYLWQDPAEGVKTVKNRDPLTRRPFSIDELQAILAVADPEWQSLIKFGLYTGQRLSDLASLTWSPDRFGSG